MTKREKVMFRILAAHDQITAALKVAEDDQTRQRLTEILDKLDEAYFALDPNIGAEA